MNNAFPARTTELGALPYLKAVLHDALPRFNDANRSGGREAAATVGYWFCGQLKADHDSDERFWLLIYTLSQDRVGRTPDSREDLKNCNEEIHVCFLLRSMYGLNAWVSPACPREFRGANSQRGNLLRDRLYGCHK